MADRELEAYQAEKDKEREREAKPAKALTEDDLSEADRRRMKRAGDRSVPPDARGQAERGRIDQIITSKNWTQTQ